MVLCFSDLGANAFLSLRQFNYADHDKFTNFVRENEPVINKIKELDPSFYRMEKTYQYSHNDAMTFSYNGLSHFSSSEKQFVKDFMGKMGFTNHVIWAYYDQGSTISADSLLGVKYLLTKTGTDKPYHLLWQQGDVSVYENPYSLPLGFMVSGNIFDVSMDEKNLFKLQNNIWGSMTGQSEKELFYPAIIDNINTKNLIEEEYENGIRYIRTDDDEAYIEYTVVAISEDPLYAYFPAKELRLTEVFFNDESLGVYFFDNRYDIISLGSHQANDIVKFKIELKDHRADVYIDDPLFYHQDMIVFRDYYNELSSFPYEIDYFTNSYFEGKIENSGNKQYALFTIPFDNGWKIELDGRPATAFMVYDTLMAIEVPEGTHSITLKFVPGYLLFGILITVITCILIFAWIIAARRKRIRS